MEQSERTNTPIQLLEQLQSMQSFEEALELYQHFVISLGYDGVLYGFAPKLFAKDALFNQPVYRACGLYSKEFLEYYFKNNLVKHDFTVNAMLNGDMNVLDWGSEETRSKLSIQERNVLEVAHRYGLKNGLSMPLMNNFNGYAGIGVCSSKEYDGFSQLNQHCLTTLRQYSQIFNSYIWSIHRNQLGKLSSEVALSRLTPKELELLRELTSGDMLKVIYHRIGRSQSAGDNLLHRLRDKMGGITTNRLIYYGSLLVANEYI